jgi:nicotinate-nucleotide adenylyltransferase
MRVAVYGGSFNPPHVAHLMVSSWLHWTDAADAVWWIPVHGHPFSKGLAPFDTRVALCRRATAELPWVSVSTIERELAVPSYTIDTLDELARRHPDHELRLVVGADVLSETAKWKAWDQIEARYRPIVVGRAGWPTPPGSIPFPEVSSTEVRRRVAAGDDVRALVPAAIRAEVERLYLTPRPGSPP